MSDKQVITDTICNITQVENYVLYHLHKTKKEYFEAIRDKSHRIIRHRKDGAMFSLILMANFLGLDPDTISPNSVKELEKL